MITVKDVYRKLRLLSQKKSLQNLSVHFYDWAKIQVFTTGWSLCSKNLDFSSTVWVEIK